MKNFSVRLSSNVTKHGSCDSCDSNLFKPIPKHPKCPFNKKCQAKMQHYCMVVFSCNVISYCGTKESTLHIEGVYLNTFSMASVDLF